MPQVALAISAGVAAVGAIAGAVGTGVQIDAQQKQAAEYARVQRVNAMLAQSQSDDAINRGAYAAGRLEATGRRTSAAALTQVAAGGQSTTSGSLANLFAASEINATMDADVVKANAVRQAWGLDIETQEHKARGRAGLEAGVLGSLGTGIGGFSSALGQLGSAAGYAAKAVG